MFILAVWGRIGRLLRAYQGHPTAGPFHVIPYGETAIAERTFHVGPYGETARAGVGDLEIGILLGILVGEGHFGGDGRQPQVTLRMHVAHESLFRWVMATFPGGRLYGPYDHSGRRYFQWMARGPYLRSVIVPLLDARLGPEIDRRSWERYQLMKERYRL